MTIRLPSSFNYDFPTYVKDCSDKDVQVYWYERNFSQSRYPPGQEISEACTIICLLVAQRICKSKILIWNVETCPQLGIFIAESIIEGNNTHAWITERGLVPHPYLNTDEALKFGGKRLKTIKEWKFHVFKEDIGKNLCNNIQMFLHKWYRNPKAECLIMLLITCGRTVLFLFQEKANKVTFFDSHCHATERYPHRGLVVSQNIDFFSKAKLEKLKSLCDWYVHEILNNCFNVQAHEYELAFLYYHQTTCCGIEGYPCDCGCSKC